MNIFTPRPDAETIPVETRHLCRAEWLLLYVFRRWLSGLSSRDHRQWELAWRELCKAVGQEPARRSLSALEGLIRILTGYAARRINHHQACCALVAPDERIVLHLIAAVQQVRLGDAEGLALTLVSPAGVADTIVAAEALGSALLSGGLRLPVRAALARGGLDTDDSGAGPAYPATTVRPYSCAASSSHSQRYSAKLRRT